MSAESKEFNYRGQLDLGIGRHPELDRNFHVGGRSFYFFDFDDNIMFLLTPIALFHKETGKEIRVSSGEYAQHHHGIGKQGLYKDYEIRLDDHSGSFRFFRDHSPEVLASIGLSNQTFVEDVMAALEHPDSHWQGPSWSCFYHAAFNQRPVSLITARGHSPETMKKGISEIIQRRILPLQPNYLGVFPVSHPQVRVELGDVEKNWSVAKLKQNAISQSVQRAFQQYGYNPHHRFGMSDDDPKNIELIAEEMRRLKHQYPENSFFLIETHSGNFIKHEIGLNQTQGTRLDKGRSEDQQLSLFS